MVCRNCGRNNPEGLASCFSCGMPLGRDLTAQQPTPYYSAPYPMPSPSSAGTQSAGFFSAGGERNLPGLIIAIIYALCVFPVYINVKFSFLGMQIATREGRLINGWTGWAVIGIAAFAGVMAYIGNNKALICAGGLAVAHMIYMAVTVEQEINALRDEIYKELSDTIDFSTLSISFGKGMGFWLLILSALALLFTGIISLVMERHDPLSY